MRIAYKTELNPTPEQAYKIRRYIGICRFLYNKYVQLNSELYAQHKDEVIINFEHTVDEDYFPSWFISAQTFEQELNTEIKENCPWIGWCNASLRKAIINNAETAFKRFFHGKSVFPRFKEKYADNIKLDYDKVTAGSWVVTDNCVEVPGLKSLKLKEHGYLPVGAKVRRGAISCVANRFYISVVVDEKPPKQDEKVYSEGIGINIDEDFIIYDNGVIEKDVENSHNVEVLKKKIGREIKSLQRKKLQQENGNQEARNIEKQKERIAKLYARLEFIRSDHINKLVAKIIEKKPKYIVLGDFNNYQDERLKKKIAQWKLPEFKSKLLNKCRLAGIEFRQMKSDMNVQNLIHRCPHCQTQMKTIEGVADGKMLYCPSCNMRISERHNIAVNLKNLKQYRVL